MASENRQALGGRQFTTKEAGALASVEIQREALAGLIDEVQDAGGDPRCVNTARTNFSTALMWLDRAIHKPEGL